MNRQLQFQGPITSYCMFFLVFHQICHYELIMSSCALYHVSTVFKTFLVYFSSGFCAKCAMQLDICPLCRKPIRSVDNDLINITSPRTRHESDSHIRTQLSHDSSSNVPQASNSLPSHNTAATTSKTTGKFKIEDHTVK